MTSEEVYARFRRNEDASKLTISNALVSSFTMVLEMALVSGWIPALSKQTSQICYIFTQIVATLGFIWCLSLIVIKGGDLIPSPPEPNTVVTMHGHIENSDTLDRFMAYALWFCILLGYAFSAIISSILYTHKSLPLYYGWFWFFHR